MIKTVQRKGKEKNEKFGGNYKRRGTQPKCISGSAKSNDYIACGGNAVRGSQLSSPPVFHGVVSSQPP